MQHRMLMDLPLAGGALKLRCACITRLGSLDAGHVRSRQLYITIHESKPSTTIHPAQPDNLVWLQTTDDLILSLVLAYQAVLGQDNY